MFAIVQHEQDAQRPHAQHESGNHIFGLDRETECRGDCRGNQLRVRNGPDVNEAHCARKLLAHCVGNGYRDGRLPHAPGADDGDKAIGDQIGGDRADCFFAANHSCKHCWQQKPLPGSTTGILRNPRRRLRVHFTPDWRDEAIALAGNAGDIPVSPVAIAKRLAQTGHVNPEVARVHDQPSPHARDQLAMADDLTGALDQHHQDVEGPVAQCERDAVLFERASGRVQPEGSERKGGALRAPRAIWLDDRMRAQRDRRMRTLCGSLTLGHEGCPNRAFRGAPKNNPAPRGRKGPACGTKGQLRCSRASRTNRLDQPPAPGAASPWN